MQTIVSTKHKLLAVTEGPKVAGLFPQAPLHTFNGDNFRLVPHGETEVYLLRQIGFEAPAPILSQYDFPLQPGLSAFDVQKKTCAMLTMSQRGYVLNGMGTGKTKCALWSFDYLKRNKRANKMLVVAPKSTLTFVWQREAFECLPQYKVNVLDGDRARRLKRLAELDADIYVVNHDGFGIIRDELKKRKDIDVLCLDELAKYRNKSERTKLMVDYASTMTWVWGMTGSPMPHEPTDVFFQCKVVTPNTVPKYFSHFRSQVMYPLGNMQKWVPKADAVDQAFAVMKPAVRYTIDEVQELPPCVERYVDVDMGTQQLKIYKDIVAHCQAAFQSGDLVTAANAGAAMNKLMQISLGWVYAADKTTGQSKTVPLDNKKRIEALVDAIDSTERKVLVFVPFIHALDGISDALTKEGYEHAVVSGQTAAAERNRVFNLFQNTTKFKVIAAHPQCVAHGLTLTAADTVVWFGPITSLEVYDQANHRIKRVGQKNKQQIIHLQSTPVERKIYKMLRGHQDIQKAFLKMFEDSNQEF
jgi:SNF2 family DNA or RNA helicase